MTTRTTNAAGPHRSIPTGFRTNKVYPIVRIMQCMGWGSRSLAEAKRRGLTVLCFSKRSYVFGGDLLEFLRAQPVIERRGGPGRPDLIAGRLTETEESQGTAAKEDRTIASPKIRTAEAAGKPQ
jgi:hypothetical protein